MGQKPLLNSWKGMCIGSLIAVCAFLFWGYKDYDFLTVAFIFSVLFFISFIYTFICSIKGSSIAGKAAKVYVIYINMMIIAAVVGGSLFIFSIGDLIASLLIAVGALSLVANIIFSFLGRSKKYSDINFVKTLKILSLVWRIAIIAMTAYVITRGVIEYINVER